MRLKAEIVCKTYPDPNTLLKIGLNHLFDTYYLPCIIRISFVYYPFYYGRYTENILEFHLIFTENQRYLKGISNLYGNSQ
jgi:hypothetical protein